MKKLFRFSAFVLLAVCLTFGSAYAADGDVYRDAYTSEDSSGLWTFTNVNSIGMKTNLHVIDAPADTTSSVTAARTGNMWVLRSTTGPAVGGVGYTLLLPTAANGLTYTFTTATNQTISVKASGTDQIAYGPSGTVRITSAASTGTTVTLVGNTSVWYVKSISSDNSGGTNIWTPAAS